MILSSLLCVASGGSLGREAPMIQVTGSTGTWLGKLFRLKGEELRSLSIAGMAAGFTTLFGAPMGGSLFSLEILHHLWMATRFYHSIVFCGRYYWFNYPSFISDDQSYTDHSKLHGSCECMGHPYSNDYDDSTSNIDRVRPFHSHFLRKSNRLLFSTQNPFH